MDTYSVVPRHREFSVWSLLAYGFLAFILWCVVAFLYYAATFPGMPSKTYFNVTQYLAEAKMSPAKNYPLKFGAPTATELTNDDSPRFFLLTGRDAVAQGLQPSDNVRLYLQIGQYGSVIEVSFDKINWNTQRGITSRTRFTIKNDDVIDSVSPSFAPWNFGSLLTFQSRELEPTRSTIHDSNTWKVLQRNGVGAFFQENLDRLYITSTPEEQAKYLGGL